ncbi:hypothetical protein H9Q73_009156 [Fusarium xylarioides]|nr:hypothetical protein H9Q73_009156 [Fusarium xylarioides]
MSKDTAGLQFMRQYKPNCVDADRREQRQEEIRWWRRCSTPSTHSPSPTKSGDRPEVHVVLCAIGDTESQSLYGEHGIRSIDVTPTDDFQGLLLDTLDVEFYKKLEEDAGVGLCYNTGIKAYEEAEANGEELPEGPDAARVTVHGIAITLLWAQYTGRITVEFKSWEWLRQKVKEGTVGTYLGNVKQDAILFTHMRRPHLSEERVDH